MTADDFPPYSIRVSRRARRISMRVTESRGLELVLPENTDHASVPEILHEHRSWIERQLARVEKLKAARCESGGDRLPNRLDLRAIDEMWQVEYVHTAAEKSMLIERAGRSLALNCEASPTGNGCVLLKGWLREKARSHLIPILTCLSGEMELRFNSVRIKSQRTVWGSCSGKGVINLNDKLLFLPLDLVRYVLIHELCHTRELNHSPGFWTLVAGFEPDYRLREAALREARRYVPLWLEQ